MIIWQKNQVRISQFGPKLIYGTVTLKLVTEYFI